MEGFPFGCGLPFYRDGEGMATWLPNSFVLSILNFTHDLKTLNDLDYLKNLIKNKYQTKSRGENPGISGQFLLGLGHQQTCQILA